MARYKGNIVRDASLIILREVLLDILNFPLWWYTTGLKIRLLNFKDKIKEINHALALSLLFRYLLKPMYGDYTRSGRIISLVVRLIHFTVLSLVGLIWGLFYFIFLIIYFILPPLVVLLVFYQITGHLFNN
jgi:hypothetical protein